MEADRLQKDGTKTGVVSAHDLAVVAVMKNAMQRQAVFLSHGSKLFPVLKGWEYDVLAKDQDIRLCPTLLDLGEALDDTDVKVLLIPKHALMNQSDIEKICRRHGVAKTLFQEVDEI